MAKRNDTDKLDALLASVTDDMLGEDFGHQFHDDSIKVERILLDLVRPDPVQPRRVLPEQIHYAFHNNRLTPTQALKELVQLVQVTARQRGRRREYAGALVDAHTARDRAALPDGVRVPGSSRVGDPVVILQRDHRGRRRL